MEWTQQVQRIAVAIAVLSGIVMIAQVGLGEVGTVILNPSNATAETNATFSGVGDAGVDYADRLMVIGLAGTVLGGAGLGLLTTSKNNPRFINDFIRWSPLLLAAVGLVAAGDLVWETLQGDRIWANFDDATNSYVVAITASVVAGAMSLIRRG